MKLTIDLDDFAAGILAKWPADASRCGPSVEEKAAFLIGLHVHEMIYDISEGQGGRLQGVAVVPLSERLETALKSGPWPDEAGLTVGDRIAWCVESWADTVGAQAESEKAKRLYWSLGLRHPDDQDDDNQL